MTRPEWEPLTTAEEVMAALDAGRKIQFTSFRDEIDPWQAPEECSGWIPETHLKKVGRQKDLRYRARIEGGAE